MSAWADRSISLALAFEDPKMPRMDPERIASTMDGNNARGELIIDHVIKK